MSQPSAFPEASSPTAASVAASPAAGRARGVPRLLGWAAGGVVLLLLAGAAARALTNSNQARALAEDSAADSVRDVLTIRAKRGTGPRAVTLPGTLRGQQEATVYARSSGYLARWTKDIGDSVQRGELLAVIEAPEADLELAQAVAVRDQVRARAALAQSSLVRWEDLGKLDAVPRQELDERRAAQGQAVADLAAAEANVKRLQTLAALRRVVAPFNGVVVRRNAEVGALVSTSNARELYHLADIDTLRIELAVPQAYAADVQPGQAVQVRWPERPALNLEGRISRAAPGIDTATRTRLVIVDLPNPGRQLLPGSYVDVQLRGAAGTKGANTKDKSPEKAPEKPAENAAEKAAGKGPDKPAEQAAVNAPSVLTVPANVLQFRQDGPRVVLVQNERAVLRNVKLGRDLGREVEVREGIGPQDWIVLNPPDTVTEGERLRAQAAPEDKPRSGAAVAGAASAATAASTATGVAGSVAAR
jgi:RND family efflux transporter MFP subunit